MATLVGDSACRAAEERCKDWSASTGWWLAAGVLVAAELATGTFYLLMLALGAAAGALAAHAGLPPTLQAGSAAVVGGGAAVLWLVLHQRRRSRQPAAQPTATNPATNPDLNLDIGGAVHVAQWQADGSARISYRGGAWDAQHVGGGQPLPGAHVIRGVEGNRLLLVPASH